MKPLKLKTKSSAQITIGAMLCLLGTLTVWGQQTRPSLTGKYEGTAKGPNGDVTLQLDLVDESGKFSGQITSPHGAYKISKGQMANGVLTLEAQGNELSGKLTLRQKDDKLVGDFTADGQTGSVEFHRVVSDEISGEWDAAADAQGQPFPFTLSLKLEGEKVTGSSSSQLGTSAISTGTWKDGKLAIILDSGAGQIGLIATFQDGKLIGDYDFAGQMQGKWVAVKKK